MAHTPSWGSIIMLYWSNLFQAADLSSPPGTLIPIATEEIVYINKGNYYLRHGSYMPEGNLSFPTLESSFTMIAVDSFTPGPTGDPFVGAMTYGTSSFYITAMGVSELSYRYDYSTNTYTLLRNLLTYSSGDEYFAIASSPITSSINIIKRDAGIHTSTNNGVSFTTRGPILANKTATDLECSNNGVYVASMGDNTNPGATSYGFYTTDCVAISTDDGATYTPTQNDPRPSSTPGVSPPVTTVNMHDNGTTEVIAVNVGTYISTTTDRGATAWSDVNLVTTFSSEPSVGSNPRVIDMLTVSNGTWYGVVVGVGVSIIKSIDNGLTWTYVSEITEITAGDITYKYGNFLRESNGYLYFTYGTRPTTKPVVVLNITDDTVTVLPISTYRLTYDTVNDLNIGVNFIYSPLDTYIGGGVPITVNAVTGNDAVYYYNVLGKPQSQ